MATEGSMAVIFDFDDTLTDDSTSCLLKKLGTDADKFWLEDVNQMVVNEGWEPSQAYLHLLLKLMNEAYPAYTHEALEDFGRTLKPYPGLSSLFRDLRKIASGERFDIDFYIVSGGLQDIIEGFPLRSEFKAVWGAQLAAETAGGPVKYIKRTISFTEKTRYLFAINKGIDASDLVKNPYEVNKDVPDSERPIPFAHMVYIGDGLSDIPCFSLIQKRPQGDQGIAFGVFHPGNERSARRAWLELIFPRRARGGVYPPRYGKGKNDALGAVLRAVVATRCSEIKIRNEILKKVHKT